VGPKWSVVISSLVRTIAVVVIGCRADATERGDLLSFERDRSGTRRGPRPDGRLSTTAATANGSSACRCRSGVRRAHLSAGLSSADYGRILHSTPPVTARLMTAAVPSLWSAPGRELTGSRAPVPRGPTTPEESGNWSRSWPSMSLSAWHSPSAEGAGHLDRLGADKAVGETHPSERAASRRRIGIARPPDLTKNAASTASPLTRVRDQRAGPFGRQSTAREAAP